MKFLDLFAGIGGFRQAMVLAGHTPVGWCEIDKYAQQSYRAIFDTEGEWVSDDITKVDTNGLPDFDCLCGGFPCQAFSIAGQRRGFEDTRGTLFFEIARIAEAKRPKILFLENVKGLFSHDSGRTFATILLALDELGYDVQWQVLNAKDFGVPQNRERVFIVGHLRGTTRPEVFPISGTNGQTIKQIVGGQQGMRVYDTAGLSDTQSAEGGGCGAKTGLYLINKNNGDIRFRDDVNCIDANYYKGLDAHQQRTGVLCVNMKQQVNTIHNNESCTIVASCYKEPPVIFQDITRMDKRQNGCGYRESDISYTLDTQATMGIKEGVKIRKLTPLECWRLMGRSDEHFYKAKNAGLSDTQLYKQAGNSVVVDVVYAIAERLAN